jgi:hypothetical protein
LNAANSQSLGPRCDPLGWDDLTSPSPSSFIPVFFF